MIPKAKEFFEEDFFKTDSLVVLQFEHILFPLIILGLGSYVAYMVFLFEIWFGKTNGGAEQRTADQAGEGIQTLSTDLKKHENITDIIGKQ